MELSISIDKFDLQALLHAVADFSDRVCGEEFQAATIATEAERSELEHQDWGDLPRYERSVRFSELEQKLRAGETLILNVGSPYVGDPVNFVDGTDYDVSEDENFPKGETDSIVLFLTLDSTTRLLTVQSGAQLGQGCMGPPKLVRGTIASLENPAGVFLHRFTR